MGYTTFSDKPMCLQPAVAHQVFPQVIAHPSFGFLDLSRFGHRWIGQLVASLKNLDKKEHIYEMIKKVMDIILNNIKYEFTINYY